MSDYRTRLESRVIGAAEAALAERQGVSAIDVLAGISWLPQTRIDEWRQGRLACLEAGILTSPRKILQALSIFGHWASQRGLVPVQVEYAARTRARQQLRFTSSNDAAIEQAYHTQWMSPELSESQRERLRVRGSRPPDLVVIEPIHDWTCSTCGQTGDFLLLDDGGPLCRVCARLDHLVFLPAGDARLSRRAKQASGLTAVVVRFSRSRKRYERQGILVERAALAATNRGL